MNNYKPKFNLKSLAFLALGYTSFVLGFIGIFLPILPTTPFMIVALWAFSKGSTKMHKWLLNHPRFGHSLQHWEAHKVIPIKAKATAAIFITGSAIYIGLFSSVSTVIATTAIGTMLCAITYVLTRPSTVPTMAADD